MKIPKIALGTMIVISTFFIGGCTSQKEEDVSTDDSAEIRVETKLPENTIIAVQSYTNGAEGYTNNGTFIDSEGEVYSYSFDQEDYFGFQSNTPLIEKLECIHQYAKPTTTIDTQIVQTLYQHGMSIPTDATYETEPAAFDAGSHILYFYNSDEEKMVALSQTGDFEGKLEMRAARKFIDCFEDMLQEETRAAIHKDAAASSPAYYYGESDLFIENCHCNYMGSSFAMLIDDEDSLKELEEMFGGDFGIRDTFPAISTDEILNRYVFYVQYDSVSSTGYDLKKQGILIQEDTLYFVPDPSSKAPGPDESVGEAMDGFCYIGAIPRFCIQDLDTLKSTIKGLSH